MAITTDEWVSLLFGRADPTDLSRTIDELKTVCDLNEDTVRRLTEVFDNPTRYLSPFSEEVVDQAIWAHMFYTFGVVYEETIGWPLRDRLIRSVEIFYREYFVPRCAPVLGHLNQPDKPLNSACYMFWDNDCWRPEQWREANDRCDLALLESMRSILAIDHIACQESALHGLGHWHSARPQEVEAIIDEFLRRSSTISPELRSYAEQARQGRVL
jgi:hypothetical protein